MCTKIIYGLFSIAGRERTRYSSDQNGRNALNTCELEEYTVLVT